MIRDVLYIALACNFKYLVPQCLTIMRYYVFTKPCKLTLPVLLRHLPFSLLSFRASGKALVARRLKRGSTCCEPTTRTQKRKLLIGDGLSRKPMIGPLIWRHTFKLSGFNGTRVTSGSNSIKSISNQDGGTAERNSEEMRALCQIR